MEEKSSDRDFFVRNLDTGERGLMGESKFAPDVSHLTAKAETPVSVNLSSCF